MTKDSLFEARGNNIIRDIFAGLHEKGCLLPIKKVLGNDSIFNSLFFKFYYEMKKREDYSALEIARKRETLKNDSSLPAW